MRKTVFFFGITALIFTATLHTTSCSRQRGDACIEISADTVAVNTIVNVTNCGSEIPTNRVSVSLDWGDGTTSSGQTGSHIYSNTGGYSIRLMMNDEPASEISDANPKKTEITIVVE